MRKTPVVHKHGIGSCEGTLTASLDGLQYVTSNKGDAFTLPYAQVETFTVDYLRKEPAREAARRQDLELHEQGRKRRPAVRVPPRRRGGP